MANEVRISGSQTTPRSECDIRAFYGDNAKIIAASNVAASPGPQAQFYSGDGGATWGQTALSLAAGDNDMTDPAVDWTTDGTAWAITIGIQGGNTRLRCYKSGDGGQTWAFDSTPSGGDTGADREMMWVDHSQTSAHKDNMYAVWQQPGPLRFARRVGIGAAWEAPKTLSGAETTGSAVGAAVKTNNDGDVFAFWPDSGSRGLFVAKSTDGGGSFGAPKKIATTFGSFEFSIPAQADRKAGIYLAVAAYKDATRDLVHAVWADLSGEAGCTSGGGPGSDVNATCKSRIWYARSIDGGGTWSAPVKINDQAGKSDQLHPGLAVDATNGNLALVYYDTVNDPGRHKVDLWMQVSHDDGQNWSSATKVTSASTDETVAGADNNAGGGLADQLGDYIGLDANAGAVWPAWCDRRNGQKEEIWSAALSLRVKECFFILDRSTFGQNEVNARLKQTMPNPADFPAAFFVVVDGFSASDLGITAADLVGAPSVKPTLTVLPAVSGMVVGAPTALLAEDTSLPAAPQRFTWVYPVSFKDDSDFTSQIRIEILSATISGVAGSAQIELLQQPNPYEMDGDPPWLSTDLRVFQLDANQSKFNTSINGSTPADARAFIKQVIANLNSGNTGGQTFDNDLPDTTLALFEKHLNGTNVFNFAIARVRYRALAVAANNVRVFFRLCPALTVSTAFDPNTTYRRFSDGMPGGHSVPLLGKQGNNILTIPCFAEQRIDASSTSMTAQTDAANVQTIPFDASGAEVDRYFGCWLDINQPSQGEFPLNPANDGPFNGPLQSVLSLVRNQHQCLIAEIAFDPAPVPSGVTPFASDKLAQRNLTLVESANPGDVASRRIPSTFELKATPAKAGASDELMIDWGHTPAGSVARIYLPGVSADEIVALAAKRYSLAGLSRIDEHTVQCPVRRISYIPIPSGPALNHPGLLTIDLPAGVRKGQLFKVVVRQISSVRRSVLPPVGERQAESVIARRRFDWRNVLGAFQLSIPVRTKETMLEHEVRLLSVLRWILASIPHHDRWYLAFLRYVQEIAQRVRGLGGDPDRIPPSPGGDLPHTKPSPHPGTGPEARIEFTGKIAGLIFDRFGDFEGFILDTEDGERRFASRERDSEELAERAWAERLRISVIVERHEPHRPQRIIVREPPAPFRG